MSEIENIESIDNSIKKLKAQRVLLLEKVKQRHRARHGIPEIEAGRQITTLTPLQCKQATLAASLLQSESWEALLKGLTVHLSCKATQICVVYSTYGKRGGQAVETAAFKHRFNKEFNALMREMKEQELANPRFVARTKTWTVERTAATVSALENNLPKYFLHIIDAQTATIFTSCTWRQESASDTPPLFTTADGIGKFQLLNDLLTLIYAEKPTTIEEIRNNFHAALTDDDYSPFSTRIMQLLPEFALAISQKRHKTSDTSELKKWILTEYNLLVERVNDEIFSN